MSVVKGYVRVSKNERDCEHQQFVITNYCRIHSIPLSAKNEEAFISVVISSHKTPKERRHPELLKLKEGDTLIVTEISRLGRSTIEVLALTNQLITQGVRVIIIKQNLDLNDKNKNDMYAKAMLQTFSLMAELERDIISLRTKEALASKKAQGQRIGKPKGTIQKSLYDNKVEIIKELLNKNISASAISRIIGIGKVGSLLKYIKRKKIKKSN